MLPPIRSFLLRPFLRCPLTTFTLPRVLCLASLVACGGCGAAKSTNVPTFPVKAEISYKGKAMPGALVTLHPQEAREDVPAPRAAIGTDGQLIVSTYNSGDGAPEGKYVVTVQWYKLVKQGPDFVPGPNVLPAKYASPKSSKIEVVVTAGENVLKPIRL